jgi:hypothetical protein
MRFGVNGMVCVCCVALVAQVFAFSQNEIRYEWHAKHKDLDTLIFISSSPANSS